MHLAETLEVEFAEPQDIVQHCNNCVSGVDHTIQISNGDVLGEILMDYFDGLETNMCTDRMNLETLPKPSGLPVVARSLITDFERGGPIQSD